MTLTDTQLVLLSAAWQRADRGIVLPSWLKGGAAQKVVKRLLDGGLAEELPTIGELPVWRRNGDGHAIALVVTAAGLTAIGVDPPPPSAPAKGDAAQEPVPAASRARRGTGAGRPTVDAAPVPKPAAYPSTPVAAAGPATVSAPRPGSKTAELIGLLRRPNGATIGDIVATLNWLPHTSRAALTGLRKRGFAFDRRRLEDGTLAYIITAEPPTLASAVIAGRSERG